jgi:hypothetical protein
MKQIILIAFMSLLTACSTKVSFFPVSGPLSQAKLSQPIVATADGIWGNTGKLTLTLPNGEVCNGRWSSVAPTVSSANVGMGSVSLSNSMASTWGTVYGTGFSVGNAASVNRGEAMLICSNSTTIQVEFFTGSGTANGYGVAKDSNGNTYKVLM